MGYHRNLYTQPHWYLTQERCPHQLLFIQYDNFIHPIPGDIITGAPYTKDCFSNKVLSFKQEHLFYVSLQICIDVLFHLNHLQHSKHSETS